MGQQVKRLRRKLTLDQDGGWIGGVCGGLANYLGIDASYLRAGTAIAAIFFTKTMIVAYVLLWLVLYQRKRSRTRTA